mmetsp:Transcript_157667/g.505597  ORF Transcript_157667/g.505597 Transcript_157667/m.505597 type:complete len:190 (+) Transcript_157667:2101-2670(+)
MTTVVSVAESSKKSRYYLNDGLYGSFNCVVFGQQEVPRPTILRDGREFSDDELDARGPCIMFGPTCDGFDLITETIEIFPNFEAETGCPFPTWALTRRLRARASTASRHTCASSSSLRSPFDRLVFFCLKGRAHRVKSHCFPLYGASLGFAWTSRGGNLLQAVPIAHESQLPSGLRHLLVGLTSGTIDV